MSGIKKILKVKNVGCYDINSVNDDYSFGKQTIIFGANKVGKTTLVSILKSLRYEEPEYVQSRKTFGVEVNKKQEIDILYKDSKHSVYNSDWTNTDIEIFDNDFISKNIFVADRIEQEHKAQLFKILIDEDNKKIQKEIDEKEIKNTELREDKDKIKLEIGADYEKFVTLKDADRIEKIELEIAENSKQLKLYQNQKQLLELKGNTKLNFDFTKFEEIISKKIDTTLESKIREHIEECHQENRDSFDFLKKGLDKINKDKNLCPFCGQSLQSVSGLIEDMNNFFSDTYKETQHSINLAIENFKGIDIEKEVAKFKAEGFEFKKIPNIENVKIIQNNVVSELEQKSKDLSIEIHIEENKNYKDFKEVVLDMHKEVVFLKANEINLQEILEEKQTLDLNKRRFSEEGVNLFEKYTNIENDIKSNKTSIDDLNRILKDNMNNLFESYEREVNEVLKDSYANFKLVSLESVSNRSMTDKFFCDYGFMFDDEYKVEITDDSNKPQFKNTLSDSDKRILAFAFFIAKLRKDPDLAKKIVVLDDPFTSLDDERRDSMINLLKDLNCNQIIILSHSRNFVKRCYQQFNLTIAESDRDMKLLRLRKNTSGKVVITKLNLDTDNDFLEGIEIYMNVLSNSTVDNIMSDYDNIRKIIEHIVKAKYFQLLNENEKSLPMKYFTNPDCKSPIMGKIQENDYQENHHDSENSPSPEELLQKRDDFIDNVLPYI